MSKPDQKEEDKKNQYIAIYKCPNSNPFLIATFDHIMSLTNDVSHADGRHIGLEPAINKAGAVMIGTKEDLKIYIDGMGIENEYVYYIPLHDVNDVNDKYDK